MVCVELKDVSYRYPTGEKKSLKHINLQIHKGEFVAVIGKNGSGKTTLCNAIRGFIPHFYKGDLNGEIYLNGKNVLEHSVGDLTLDAGYVFQNPFSQTSGTKETVFEEIGYGLECTGMDRMQIIEKVRSIIQTLQIEHLAYKSPLSLSGGQRQRVSLASIIVMEPEVLIIDEPTSQLDPKGTADVFEIIRKLKSMGKTVILVEHKIDLVAKFADRVIFMDSGKIVLDGPAKEVLTSPILEEYNCTMPQYAVLGREMMRHGYPVQSVPITLHEAKKIVKPYIRTEE